MLRQSFLSLAFTASLASLVSAQGVLLGIQVEEPRKGGAGLAVLEVVPGSPAEVAGIESGDVLTRFNDVAMTSLEKFTTFIDEHKAGDVVSATFVKDGGSGKELTRSITLGKGGAPKERPKKPRAQARPEKTQPGLIPAPNLPGPYGEKGVPAVSVARRTYLGVVTEANDGSLVITEVLPETPAARHGLKAEDVIVEFDGKARATSDELRKAIQSHKSGEKVAVRIRRDDKEMVVPVILGDAPTEEMWKGMAPNAESPGGVTVVTPIVPMSPTPAEVEALKREVTELRAMVADLRAQIADLKAQIRKKEK